ncbi:PD-(D/E)XK motif protein [Streptacidiphilus pinicola]|nr:PD-(D/E)XK motif protein [Streptacidiphilus pinicola]
MLEQMWMRLDQEAIRQPDARMLSAELQIPTVQGLLRLGRSAEGRRHLLVPIAPEDQLDDDRRSAGVHLVTRSLLLGDELPVRYADLSCRRADLQTTFTSLVAELCVQIAAEPEGRPARIARTLNAWRLLFGGTTERWTLPRLAGLFAELVVLEALLDREPGAIRHWLGPLGCPQDFRGSKSAIEVKATTAADNRVVRIHGADQLETPPGTALFLAWFRVAKSSAPDARSVFDVLEACSPRVEDLEELETRLRALGLPSEGEGPASDIRFVTIEQRWYEVGDQFPRITPGSFLGGVVPVGAMDLEYSIDLDTVPAHADRERVITELGADI